MLLTLSPLPQFDNAELPCVREARQRDAAARALLERQPEPVATREASGRMLFGILQKALQDLNFGLGGGQRDDDLSPLSGVRRGVVAGTASRRLQQKEERCHLTSNSVSTS
jgi:hypothetical protein